jgi:hypothetical protein
MQWSNLIIDFTFLMNDGAEIRVRNSLADVLQWEANNKGQSFQENASTTNLVWLGWAAAKRQKLTDLEHRLFTRELDDFAMEVVDRGADPTNPDQSDD